MIAPGPAGTLVVPVLAEGSLAFGYCRTRLTPLLHQLEVLCFLQDLAFIRPGSFFRVCDALAGIHFDEIRL